LVWWRRSLVEEKSFVVLKSQKTKETFDDEKRCGWWWGRLTITFLAQQVRVPFRNGS